MAGVSTKEIKNRIKSMESTRQITKAMEMVAASKLRKAQAQVLTSRPYFEILYATVNEIADTAGNTESCYLQKRSGAKALYIVIAGDRGLAGGYNSNVLKLAQSEMKNKEATVIPIGKKAVEFFENTGSQMLTEQYTEAATVSMGDCFTAAKTACKLFVDEKIDELYVCYTNYVSVLSQEPSCLRILPLSREVKSGGSGAQSDIIYEPSSAEVFDAIIPEYVGGVIYGALCESFASEQAARRTAMDSATQNAHDMIAELSLAFNRARQAAITQEITEIVAGSQ